MVECGKDRHVIVTELGGVLLLLVSAWGKFSPS